MHGKDLKPGWNGVIEAKRSGYWRAGLHHPFMLLLRSRKVSTLIVFFGLCVALSAQALPMLKVVVGDETLGFQLEAATGTDPRVLQHSVDGKTWEDVIFLEQLAPGVDPAIEIARKVLAGGVAKSGFFRAARLEEDDFPYRTFLESRVKWRTEGPSRYPYVVSSSRGLVSSETSYTVIDGETTMFEVISIYPPFFTPPSDRTIEDWFQIIASAREQDAVTIDVTWDRGLGFPATGFIDLDERLADEEQQWSIREVTPLN